MQNRSSSPLTSLGFRFFIHECHFDVAPGWFFNSLLMLQSLFLRKCRLVCLKGLSRNSCYKSNADICVIPAGNAGTSQTSERQGSRRPIRDGCFQSMPA